MVQHIPAHITLSPKLQRLVHSTEAARGTASWGHTRVSLTTLARETPLRRVQKHAVRARTPTHTLAQGPSTGCSDRSCRLCQALCQAVAADEIENLSLMPAW